MYFLHPSGTPDIKNLQQILFESFIFGNDFFLQKFRNSENLFIDGAFHIVPEFIQLLIIMYLDKEIKRKIPALFVLMNSKCENTYLVVLTSFIELLSFGNVYKPEYTTITTDNEDALNKVIIRNFPAFKGFFAFSIIKKF